MIIRKVDGSLQHFCPICNSKLNTKLYAKANYNKDELDSYAFASRKVPEYMHHDIIICESCQFLFCVDILDQKKLHHLYQEAAYDSAEEAKNASNTYINYLNKYTGYDSPKGKVMDIGTGEGSFLKLLKENGYNDVIGIEPSKSPIEYADESVRHLIINDIFIADNFEKSSFDLITLFQTIEHIPDTRKLTKDIWNLLKPHGILYVICHDYQSWINSVLGTKSPIYDVEHLQLFSKNSICKVLDVYSSVNVFTIKNSYSLSYWLKLIPIQRVIKKHLLRFLDLTKLGNLKIAANVGNIAVFAQKGKIS